MIFFAISFTILLVSWYTIGNLSKDNYYGGVNLAIYYVDEFGPGILLNVIYPCCFYISNEDARMYIKKLLFKNQKIKCVAQINLLEASS